MPLQAMWEASAGIAVAAASLRDRVRMGLRTAGFILQACKGVWQVAAQQQLLPAGLAHSNRLALASKKPTGVVTTAMAACKPVLMVLTMGDSRLVLQQLLQHFGCNSCTRLRPCQDVRSQDKTFSQMLKCCS
jgi:hypothetical protein